MLLVKCPDDYFHNEREYIYDVVLNDFLGLEHKVVFEKRDDLCITCDGKELLIDDTFFHMPKGEYFSQKVCHKRKWIVGTANVKK